MNKSTQNLAAIILILVVLAGLGLHLWGDAQANRYFGPVHLAINGQTIVVGDAEGLVELDALGGRVLSQTNFATLKVPAPLADMQRLQNGDLLLAESETATVWRCRLAETRCERFANLHKIAGRFLKIHYDEAGARLWVAATHDNKIWQLVSPFDRAHAATVVDGLAAPNEIWFSPGKTLWVCNTDVRAIQEFSTASKPYRQTGRKLSGRNEFTGKRWPLDFAGNDDQGWWVLLSSKTYLNKALLAYRPDGTARQLVRLPDGAAPVAVEAYKDSAFVADIDGFSIYRVAHDGTVSPFGDQVYAQRMARLRTQYHWYRTLSWAGVGLLALGVLGVLVVAISAKARKRQLPEPPPIVEPLVAKLGIYWLDPDQRLVRLKKFLMLATLLLAPLPIVVFFLLQGGMEAIELDFNVQSWLLGMTLLPVLLLIPLRRLFPQIGSDGQRLYVRRGDQPATSTPLSKVRHNARTLWIGDEFVNVKDGRGRAIYQPTHLQQHVTSLLAADNRMGEWPMLLAMLRKGHIGSWLLVILLLGGLLLMAADWWPGG